MTPTPTSTDTHNIHASTDATGAAIRGHAGPGLPAARLDVPVTNPALVLAAVGLLLAWVTIGVAHEFALGLFYGGLLSWALLKTAAGVIWLHRVLGARSAARMSVIP